jgi:dienelactone hydrolase
VTSPPSAHSGKQIVMPNELAEFSNQWANETRGTIALLRALPVGQYDLRPDVGGRSMGELAWHVAEVDAYVTVGIAAGEFRFEVKPPHIRRPKTIPELAPAFEVVHGDAVARVAQLQPADLDREIPYPAQIDDTMVAYRWLLDQGIKADQIALAGDSSGGGLALSGLARGRDQGLPKAAAAITISAWTDMQLTGDTYQSNRNKDPLFVKEMVEGLGEAGNRRDPYASPLYADLAGLSPIYMQAGGDEALLDDSRLFAERAKEARVDVRLDIFPEMLHTFQMAAGRAPEADDGIRRLASWVRPKGWPL